MATVLQGITGSPYCPACHERVGNSHKPGCSEGRSQEAALRRPADFAKLSGREQWDIDKSLGILDWEGY